MGRLRDFRNEWIARRAGSKWVSRDIQKSARDVLGAIGYGWSNAWDTMAESSDAYVKSFDPRIPPSLFISQRDRTRLNQPIPLVERRIEAHGDDGESDLTAEELDWGNQSPGE